MLRKFRKCLKEDKGKEINKKYVFVPEWEINKELKRNIIELETLGEDGVKFFKENMHINLKTKEKQKVRIWVCRDTWEISLKKSHNN